MRSCVQAVAWTFGIEGRAADGYAPSVEA
jgi:hypothetical protein